VTPLDAALIRRKLALIVQNLDDLSAIGGSSIEEYLADRIRRKAAERLLQEAIEAAVDINLHVLRERKEPAPPDYYRSFVVAGNAGVLPRELADRLAPAAGLRNRLVHQYDSLDDSRVLAAIRVAQRDLGDYVVAIESFLQSEVE
jgi:uncharacterized protein YutE (UPF0331/DUF86 family)